MRETIPYTYLIGWTKLDLWYYGVQYKRGCSPEQLWTKYFTSSTYVKETVEKYGQPDIIQIRKTFTCPLKAQEWERKVITRLRCAFDDKWLNRGNWGIDFNPCPEKRKRSDSCRQKISGKRKKWIEENPEKALEHVSKMHNKDVWNKISTKAKSRHSDPEWRGESPPSVT